MCNALFQTGSYFRPSVDPADVTDNLNPLEGTLSHICFVKARRDRKPKVNKLAKAAGEFHPPRARRALSKVPSLQIFRSTDRAADRNRGHFGYRLSALCDSSPGEEVSTAGEGGRRQGYPFDQFPKVIRHIAGYP